jgi:hypothetical protein
VASGFPPKASRHGRKNTESLLKSQACEKACKTARENPAVLMRTRPSLFGRTRVIFSGYRRVADGFPPVAVPDCDSVTIRAHWRMTKNCPVSAYPARARTAPENLVRGHAECRPVQPENRPAGGKQYLRSM